jgi:hypothetical protein
VPLDKLSRKELQGLAIKAGVKANAKSAEIIQALQKLQSNANDGAAALMENPAAGIGHKTKTAGLPPSRSAEQKEIADLARLGIFGKTPGGGQWRGRVKHQYNLRSKKEDTATGAENDEEELSFRI